MRSIFTTILLGCLTLNFAIAQCQGVAYRAPNHKGVYSNYTNQNTWVDAQHMSAIIQKCFSAENRDDFIQFRDAFYDLYCDRNYGDSTSFCQSVFFGPFCDSLKRLEEIKFPKPPEDSIVVYQYRATVVESQADDHPGNYGPITYQVPMYLSNMQGYMINSLSTFLANRFKDEATNMALKSLFKRMLKEDSTIVASLFPRTFRFVTTLLDEGSYYTADLLQMRQIIGMDLRFMDQSFEDHKERIFANFEQYPKEHTIFNLALDLLQRNETLSKRDFLHSLPRVDFDTSRQYLDWLDFNLMLSEAISDKEFNNDFEIYYKENGIKWISQDRIRPSKIEKDTAVLFFYGLLEAQLSTAHKTSQVMQYRGSKLGRATSMWHLLDPFKEEPLIFTKEYKDSSSIMTGLVHVNDAFNYLRSLTIDGAVQTSFGIEPTSFEIANQLLELTRAFRLQRYQEALNVLSLYFFKYIGGSLKDLHSVSFLIQFAEVQNMQQMQYLIESYALPIGASSIKRHSKFNVSLNAYVGATGGYETAYGSKQTQSKWNVGLTAPIGVSTTFAKGHLTGFVSILDLGSMVNQRLNNDTTAYSNLKFEQFTAPGVGLFYNVKSNPITFGVMFNYIPNLRTITYNDGTATITETNTNVTRLNFSLLMDIPLFTLYNRK